MNREMLIPLNMCIAFFKRVFNKKQTSPMVLQSVKAVEVIEQIKNQDEHSAPPKAVKATQGVLTVVYPFVTAAVKATGINRGSIHKCLTGKRKTAGGYTWSIARRMSLGGDRGSQS